jgi:hypothetical protein
MKSLGWLLPLCLLASACSGGANNPGGTVGPSGSVGDGGLFGDGGAASADGSPFVPSIDAAIPLGACPCPGGSYCDLATNHCKAGCLGDVDCPATAYCDTTARQCAPGCRSDNDCAMTDQCLGHACINNCGSCDDGDPCTVDSCQRGLCMHAAGNDGAQCADVPCTQNSVCLAGKCTHPAMPDGTKCGGTTPFQFCRSGACTTTRAMCQSQQQPADKGTPVPWAVWQTPTTSGMSYQSYCACSGTTLSTVLEPGLTSNQPPQVFACAACLPSVADAATFLCY